MKTREQIISSMCYTYRHDYGLDKPENDNFASKLSSGMTQTQRESLNQLKEYCNVQNQSI